ncbi:YrzI family small protein [Bacillus sp. NPDC094077]
MTFHIFFFTVALQKKVLSNEEAFHKKQFKQTMDKVTDIKSSYYTQMY